MPTRLTRLAATLIVGLALVLAPLMAAAGCPSGAMPVGTAAGTAHGGAGTSSTHHHAASKETAAAAGEAPSTTALKAANEAMHRDMDIAYTGDADVDFARGMIPHHEGAVAMARAELAHGKDPALRELAEAIIAAQEKEIAFLKAWLAEHGAE